MKNEVVNIWWSLASPDMGHWGTCPSSTSNCLLFWVTLGLLKPWHSTKCGCLSSKNIQTDSFVIIYCMIFRIFSCVALKLSCLSFVTFRASSHQILTTPCTVDYVYIIRGVVPAAWCNESVVGWRQSGVITDVIFVILRQQWRHVDVTDTFDQHVTAGVSRTPDSQLAAGTQPCLH